MVYRKLLSINIYDSALIALEAGATSMPFCSIAVRDLTTDLTLGVNSKG